ncbi:Uu.00g059290.m01.CDS01 [Anthostomella pinea]|uniref:Uu.00g059290.m01.CDS01 n=1 Tax=Anthostomella pinea TaxID=933095 RepID=A0AAI8VSP6_9PEZI|nr:Uu.00g059290.m01.CDS01 [Anthostomella pinea]
MSVPPQLIRVKRKATEDAPVSYLRVQENKRHRSEVFVYQRQDEKAAFAANIPPQVQKPIIHTSKPAFQSVAKQNINAIRPASYDGPSSNFSCVSATTGPDAVGPTAEPRRFHMSRKEMMLATSPYPTRAHGGVSKKRPAPALFVERRIKRISSRTVEKLHAATNSTAPASASASPPAPAPALAPVPPRDAVTEDMDVDTPEPRKFKKPGIAKLLPKDDTSKYKAELPKAMTQRWNVDMDKLTAEMDAYAMEQIGLNIQKGEEEKSREEVLAKRTPSKLRFKPKPPAKRYAERHPEEAGSAVDKEMVDADVDVSDSDDGDYIIETYVRVPASRMGDQVPPQKVGLLVFDEEPDIEYFYGEGDDSDDEWAEDEEDENAEDYYTADYPDDEVASDDEFGKNPYSFRNGNASDLEEYDVDNDTDDSAPGEQEQNAAQFRTYIGPNGLRSNHL